MKRSLRRPWGLVTVLAAAGFVLAAIAWGQPQASAQYEYPKRVTICHHTGSQTNPTVTITVSRNALPAHFAHGDTLGPCP